MSTKVCSNDVSDCSVNMVKWHYWLKKTPQPQQLKPPGIPLLTSKGGVQKGWSPLSPQALFLYLLCHLSWVTEGMFSPSHRVQASIPLPWHTGMTTALQEWQETRFFPWALEPNNTPSQTLPMQPTTPLTVPNSPLWLLTMEAACLLCHLGLLRRPHIPKFAAFPALSQPLFWNSWSTLLPPLPNVTEEAAGCLERWDLGGCALSPGPAWPLCDRGRDTLQALSSSWLLGEKILSCSWSCWQSCPSFGFRR